MIAILDYGLGNIRAFANIYENLDLPFFVASTPDELKKATKVILPGVGAFDRAMQLLSASGMRPPLEELVLGRGVPVLGVCVGMQMLARSSEEGTLPGLGWIDGEVRRFVSPVGQRLLLPHMGWNSVVPRIDNALLRGLSQELGFYFLHSYYFRCVCEADSIGETDYGVRFASAINSKNFFGVQFHPEKSHRNGIQLLKNFGTLA